MIPTYKWGTWSSKWENLLPRVAQWINGSHTLKLRRFTWLCMPFFHRRVSQYKMENSLGSSLWCVSISAITPVNTQRLNETRQSSALGRFYVIYLTIWQIVQTGWEESRVGQSKGFHEIQLLHATCAKHPV